MPAPDHPSAVGVVVVSVVVVSRSSRRSVDSVPVDCVLSVVVSVVSVGVVDLALDGLGSRRLLLLAAASCRDETECRDDERQSERSASHRRHRTPA